MFFVPGDHCGLSSIGLNETLEASENACGHDASPCKGDQYHALANGPSIMLGQRWQSMPFAKRAQDCRAVRTSFSSFFAIVHRLYKALPTVTLL